DMTTATATLPQQTLAYGHHLDRVSVTHEVRPGRYGHMTMSRELAEALVHNGHLDWCGPSSYAAECLGDELAAPIENAQIALDEADRCEHGVAHDLMNCKVCEAIVLRNQ
ncbi:unnamed protein product, partial [marine sediment metagenome]